MVNIRIKNPNTGDIVEVNNNNLQVTNPYKRNDGYSGFLNISSLIDDGSVSKHPKSRAFEATEDYRLRVGVDNILFSETFASTTLNTSIWTAATTTMTAVIVNGWMVLNSGSSAAATVDARLQTWRYFPVIGSFGTYIDMAIIISAYPIVNNVTEWGVGICTARSLPTDGVFFRINSQAELRCVLCFNSNEIMSEPLDFDTFIKPGYTRHYRIVMEEDGATFWIDGKRVAVLYSQFGTPSVTSSSSLPLFARTYNTTVTAVAQQIKIGHAVVSIADTQFGKQWGHALCGFGQMCYQGASGMTVGQTAQLAISANPAAATATATTAALGAGLGGVFLANITGLAVTTDYIISSFLVPAGSATAQGKTLYVTGVRFYCANAGAANAAAILSWVVGLNFGNTGVSQATAEAAATKKVRKIHIGGQTLPASANIGDVATPAIMADFGAAPIVVQSGEFIQTFIRFTNYTSTTSQALWCYVTFTGYWE